MASPTRGSKAASKVHPHLKEHFRNELQPMIELKIKNLEASQNNLSMNIQIDALQDKWVSWLNSNKDGFRIPN